MSATQPVVFITGVSAGLGHALAGNWLDSGARVLGLSRREPSDLSSHPLFEFASVDLADHASIPRALDLLLRNTEQLDCVVLNAGILGEIGDLATTALEESKRVVDINLWANKVVLDEVLRGSRTVAQVVTISSGAAVNGSRGWGAYSISKAALNMMTLLYAREFPATHFSALAPGLIDTDMQEYLCGLPADERFPSLEALKSRRNSDDMPDARRAAVIVRNAIGSLIETAESGGFHDVRELAPR